MDETSQPNQQPPSDQTCAKCEEYLAGWKRAQADYANLKRESEKQKIEFSKFANERLLTDLLPAIDQFDMALTFVPDLSQFTEEQRKPTANWITGIKAVRSLWETAFKEIGLQPVPSTGAFDPAMHEAVGQEASDTVPSGEIVRTTQIGWQLNGKLLRPSKVIIAQ